MRAAPPAPVIAAIPVFTWTGFYVGVNAGYGWNTHSNDTVFVPGVGFVSNGGSNGGFVGGGQVGYNYQMGMFVLGAETDIQYADLGHNNNNGLIRDDNGNWFGTARVRAGVAFDRALIYATGGFAYGDIGRHGAYYDPVLGYSGGSSTNTGWTVGGGVEYAFTNNLTAKVEGLYVNLDSGHNDVLGFGNTHTGEFGVVRAGLNYKFNSY
jgi:outer membrane immunogenic protein